MSGFLVCKPNTKDSLFSFMFADEVARVMGIEGHHLASNLAWLLTLVSLAWLRRQGNDERAKQYLNWYILL